MFDGSEVEIFLSPNCSKIAVECYWIREFLKYVRTLGFWKKRWALLGKNLNFLKIGKRGNFAVKCVLNDTISKIVFFTTRIEVFTAGIK